MRSNKQAKRSGTHHLSEVADLEVVRDATLASPSVLEAVARIAVITLFAGFSDLSLASDLRVTGFHVLHGVLGTVFAVADSLFHAHDVATAGESLCRCEK